MNKRIEKKDKVIMWITSIICVLPIILSAVIYQDLPEQIAVHWNTAGTADGYLPRSVAAIGLPLLFLAVNLYSKIRLFGDPKRAAHSKALTLLSTWLIPLLALVIVPLTLFISMGLSIPIALISLVTAGGLMIICGNYIPKCRRNYTMGLKLPWTLHSDDNWNKTHRMAGILWILGGIVIIVSAFLLSNNLIYGVSLTITVVLILAVAPVLYSFLLYKGEER
ncbi:SdpI family protein [uncultured Robinsoniella sp.]|uniref:SdpI family protein n=1 Tax=uncultured Robinsoniella sp. TaxID=904190 RepID=UPI00374F9293